jgi:hypothetical protein
VIVPAAAKLAIFIDETYQVVEPERPNTFYFLASVFLAGTGSSTNKLLALP